MKGFFNVWIAQLQDAHRFNRSKKVKGINDFSDII